LRPERAGVERVGAAHEAGELLFDELAGRRGRVRPARAARPAGVDLDEDEGRRVAYGGSVGLRPAVGRNGVRRDREAVDGDAGAAHRRRSHRRSRSFSASSECACSVGKIPLSTPFTDCTSMLFSSGSPAAADIANDLASSTVTCGGIIEICGSVRTSNTHGLSARSAASQPDARSSARSTRMPSKPSMRANSAYGKSGRDCEPGYFGSPDSIRISHVTWLRSRLLATKKISRGSLHRSQ